MWPATSARRARWETREEEARARAGLGLLPSGGLTAVYADVGANAQGGENRVSTRPPG